MCAVPATPLWLCLLYYLRSVDSRIGFSRPGVLIAWRLSYGCDHFSYWDLELRIKWSVRILQATAQQHMATRLKLMFYNFWCYNCWPKVNPNFSSTKTLTFLSFFLLIELVTFSAQKKTCIFVFWAHRSWWKFESIPSLARMDKQTTSMLLAFETSLILKSPSTVWNLISVHPPQRQVECRGLTWLNKWDPHSAGGICTLSAEMGVSSIVSLSH